MAGESDDFIREQAERIKASGVLGRSRSYRRLFDYLVENTLSGRSPKEVEIAVEVFSRGDNFDPSQDSMVRVYAHNLRQKIRQFYESQASDETRRLYLPRGEYRLSITEEAEEPEQLVVQRSPLWQFAVPVLTLLAGLVLGLFLGSRPDSADGAANRLWAALADDALPVQVVVGDYYIFGERDDSGEVTRFVREFTVNSSADLAGFAARSGVRADRYQDLELSYLPQSTGPALGDVLRVVHSLGRPVEVVPMSEFDPANLRSHHIVYVGYLSALDKLFDFVFAASGLAIGATYDELIDIDSGEIYSSSAGLPSDYRNYRDYGYFSTFPGPGGNQFVVVAGTRDEGVMHVAQIVSDPAYVPATVDAVPAEARDAFEMLYEVTGFDRTYIDATLVYAAPLHDGSVQHGDAGRLPARENR